MSSDSIIALQGVWKKYSLRDVFHRSLRDDLVNMFRPRHKGTLRDDEFWALKNIDLSVERGESVGLYGPNGAGKSTILKLIASVTYPDQGDVAVGSRVAPLIEIGAGFHPDLTGRENVYMNGAIIGMSLREIRDRMGQIIAFSGLERFIDMPVRKYSSGMYLRLGFSIAIHSNADILLLDEILAVGDEAFQNKCLGRIRKMRSENRTMIVVSHDKFLMEGVVDRIIILDGGLIQHEQQCLPTRAEISESV